MIKIRLVSINHTYMILIIFEKDFYVDSPSLFGYLTNVSPSTCLAQNLNENKREILIDHSFSQPMKLTEVIQQWSIFQHEHVQKKSH